jgi:hypothetical protein
MELLDICLTTTYFQSEDKFYQQKVMTKGNSSVVSSIFMEHFEKMALDIADYKPAKWIRYLDDIFVVWPHGPTKLQQFLHQINSVTPTVKFAMEVEANDTLQFSDILVMKRGPELPTKVYWKPTHTGPLHFRSNHPQHVKSGVVHSLVKPRSYVKIRRILTMKL